MHGSQSSCPGSCLLIGFLTMFLVGVTCPVSGLAGEPIKIGVIDALSGPAKPAFGGPSLLGWQMVAEQINSKGGINGSLIEIVPRDSQFSDAKALAAAEELILKEGVHFLGGTSNSASALAISKLAKEKKKIFMVHVARSERITGEKGHRYVFQAAPNSIIEGKSGARYAKYRKYLKWYIVGEDYEYGHSIARNFWTELQRVQPTVEKVGEAWVPLGTADYSPNMQEIISKNPTGVLVAFGASGMARFMSQAVKAKLLEKTHLFLNLMADPAVNAQLAETPVSENALGSTSYLWYYPSTPENKEFVRQYYEFMKKTGESDPIPPGSTFFSGYCSARFLTEAIKKAGTVDTEEVIDALEGMTIDTPVGPITMRSCDHQATTPVYWGRMERGEVRGLPIILAPYNVVVEDLLPTCEEIGVLRKRSSP
ncbi:MAG: ABC transporter substrate-binding protein [Desulfomonilaceae bacterium]